MICRAAHAFVLSLIHLSAIPESSAQADRLSMSSVRQWITIERPTLQYVRVVFGKTETLGFIRTCLEHLLTIRLAKTYSLGHGPISASAGYLHVLIGTPSR